MAGTEVSYISGKRRNAVGAIFGEAIYPTNLNADSEAIIDNPYNSFQDYWNAQAYMDWFTFNVDKYGLATAQNKMKVAKSQWSILGNELEYACFGNFAQFFKDNGVDVSNTICNVVNDASDVITNTGNTAAFISKLFIPAVIIAIGIGGVWAYNKYGKKAISGRRKADRRHRRK